MTIPKKIYDSGAISVKYDGDFNTYLISNVYGNGHVRIPAGDLEKFASAIQIAQLHRDHGEING